MFALVFIRLRRGGFACCLRCVADRLECSIISGMTQLVRAASCTIVPGSLLCAALEEPLGISASPCIGTHLCCASSVCVYDVFREIFGSSPEGKVPPVFDIPGCLCFCSILRASISLSPSSFCKVLLSGRLAHKTLILPTSLLATLRGLLPQRSFISRSSLTCVAYPSQSAVELTHNPLLYFTGGNRGVPFAEWLLSSGTRPQVVVAVRSTRTPPLLQLVA